MQQQPHITYNVASRNSLTFLESIEATVPGTLVYGRRSYGRRLRLKNATPEQRDAMISCEIYAPLHAAWLVEGSLAHNSIAYTFSAKDIGRITGWSNEPAQRKQIEIAGRAHAEAAVTRGELRAHVLDIATPYQFMGVEWASSRPWAMNVWACGSGKTLGAIMSSLSRPGPILIVCPAKARHVWWSQVQE